MAHIMSQTPLTTVRKTVDTGPGGSINALAASNYSGGAVVFKVYLVPLIRASSTITDHLVWIASCASNTTVALDLNRNSIQLGTDKYRLEAEAASASAITLTVLGS